MLDHPKNNWLALLGLAPALTVLKIAGANFARFKVYVIDEKHLLRDLGLELDDAPLGPRPIPGTAGTQWMRYAAS